MNDLPDNVTEVWNDGQSAYYKVRMNFSDTFKSNRIKELAKQATRIEETDGLFPREVFDQEKFAELIIRECHKVVFQYTGPKSALNILEHFGIEE